MLPFCFSGTNVSVTSLTGKKDKLIAGETTTFRLEVNTSISEVAEQLQNLIRQQNVDSIPVYSRFLLCNARR
jgi:hypothetical protein